MKFSSSEFAKAREIERVIEHPRRTSDLDLSLLVRIPVFVGHPFRFMSESKSESLGVYFRSILPATLLPLLGEASVKRVVNVHAGVQ